MGGRRKDVCGGRGVEEEAREREWESDEGAQGLLELLSMLCFFACVYC